jgi:hypothetical protein
MQIASLIVGMAAFYVAAGALVALAFLTSGIERLDPASKNAYSFRALIFPGLVLLWPYVLVRWMRAARSTHP